jgi:ParB-like chromosome segregation protein Spo0J
MTIQTLTHAQIQPSVLNPRKVFNDTTIEELAQSIKTDGLLQNLVVSETQRQKQEAQYSCRGTPLSRFIIPD